MNTPVLILVHGAWHDSSCWDQTARKLRSRGCEVVCPDLPGHGADTLPLSKITLKKYVAALVELLQASAQPVILLGHSMAGMVVSEAACLVPEKIKSLVYLSAYLPRDGESLFDLITLNRSHEPFIPIEMAMELSTDRRRCSIDAGQITPLFYTDVPEPEAQILKQQFGTQATLPLSAGAKIRQDIFRTLDTCYICCSRDKVIPLHHQRRMLNRQPCNTVLHLEADHSPFYSCPQALADLLWAYCRT